MKLFILESLTHVQHLFWKRLPPCASAMTHGGKGPLESLMKPAFHSKAYCKSSSVVIDIIQLSEGIPGAVFFSKYIPQWA